MKRSEMEKLLSQEIAAYTTLPEVISIQLAKRLLHTAEYNGMLPPTNYKDYYFENEWEPESEQN